MGKDELLRSLTETQINTGTAKNIILCIGDGMSIPTLAAARIYKGQTVLGNLDGAEKEYLTFERLKHTGHSKVVYFILPREIGRLVLWLEPLGILCSQ